MGKVIDLTGQQFGRLAVVKRVENNKHKQSQWLCQCECGNMTTVNICHLKSGNTKSCGCLQKERVREVHLKHSHACKNKKSRIYYIWISMINRCNNSNNKYYKSYGGRGIRVCEAWLRFENFLADMGEKPNSMSLDRVDNNGNYGPENCRWSTNKEQQRNTRSNRLITIDSITKPLVEWCNFYNINYHKIYMRLHHGWSPEEAFELVLRRKSNG